MVEPISPPESVKHRIKMAHDFVIETWNSAITSNWDGEKSIVNRNEIIQALIFGSPTRVTRSDAFKNGWLDITDMYKEKGWKVDVQTFYDEWNDCVQTEYVFKRKKK